MANVNDPLKAALRSNVKVQAYLINAALEQFSTVNNGMPFLVALREVIEVNGGISRAAKQTNINRQHLYKILSRKGNPSFANISSLLATVGLKLKVELLK